MELTEEEKIQRLKDLKLEDQNNKKSVKVDDNEEFGDNNPFAFKINNEESNIKMSDNPNEGVIHISDFKTLEKEVRVAMIGNVDSGKV